MKQFLGYFFVWCSFSVACAAEWTLMVYMEANNNLENAALVDIETIKQGMAVNPTDEVNLILQISRTGDTSTRRYSITAAGTTEVGVLPRMGQDPVSEVTNFVSFCIDNYPANKYGLILWSHGSGAEVWKPPYKQVSKQKRGILYNDIYNTALGNQGLIDAMQVIYTKLGRKLDLFANDACYMGAAEKAYDMRGFVNMFVGSEDTEPAVGFDYVSLLSAFTLTPSITPQQLATLMVHSYGTYFSATTEKKWILAAVDLSAVEDMVDALHEVIDDIDSYRASLGSGGNTVKKRVQRARKSSQEMTVTEFVDLKTFLQNLLNQLPTVPKRKRPSPQQAALLGLRRSITTTLTRLTSAVVARVGSSLYSNAGGLTIVFPTNAEFDESYQGTAFANFQPWWITFVTSYFG